MPSAIKQFMGNSILFLLQTRYKFYLVLLTIKICTFGLNILEHLKKILTKIAAFI
jgi:hypothetical protein